ncbi:MAG TPA: TetR family transcriptional regulator [Actinoallomurus sp.]|jgi:hypothetical protein|nr:TetR family transcriptional regulator [Actinoallomurus sp.]
MLDHFWWGSIFFINIPVSAVALLLGLVLIPESRSAVAPRPDYTGLLLSTFGLTALVYGAIQEEEYGWADARVWGVMAAGAIMVAAFVTIRLFREQGYDATTVEQITEAAEVSPSTFFRYYPTKEDTVLSDEYDSLIVDTLRAQPPDSLRQPPPARRSTPSSARCSPTTANASSIGAGCCCG